ncbi:MAG: SDR family oxidoreductase [Candidatus Omnitrophota bacterium]
MNKKRTIFLTGATGLIASYLLKLLLENGNKVYALARGKKDQSAKDRVIDMLKFWQADISPDLFKNLTVVEGDITYSDLVKLDAKDILNKLYNEIEIIFHSAALAELKVLYEKIKKINVDGTRNVLDFALKCKKLKKVNHISTAYVVGDKNGIEFSEDMLDVGQGFHNTYEQTKFEAEVLCHEYIDNKGLNISIFRPSMVMGDSIEGKTNNFRLFYEPLHFFSKEIYEAFPVNPNYTQNLINNDVVGKAIFALGEIENIAVYHIVSPNHITMQFFMQTAAEHFGYKLPKLIPIEKFNFNQWTASQKLLAEPFIPYFNFNTKFLSKKTGEIFNKVKLKLPEIKKESLIKIFNFCNKADFIKN